MIQNVTLNGVYYLESQNPGMNPIAIRPGTTPPDYFAWEDTGNGRILHIAKILVDGKELKAPLNTVPENIEIISSTGDKYKFVKLSTKIFNEKLKNIVAGGKSLNFKDDDELQQFYLRGDFYSAGPS